MFSSEEQTRSRTGPAAFGRVLAFFLVSGVLTLGAWAEDGPPLEQREPPEIPLVGTAPLESPAATISLDEIRRGQRGYGVSVFAGLERERFEVEVLGVLRDFTPQGSAIIARLTGQGLEESGVIGGMSGSPVYIDGRLAGAVAFSWNYAKEAIAGITPISAMRRLATGGGAAQGAAPASPGLGSSGPSATRPVVSLNEFLQGEIPEDLLVTELTRLRPASVRGTASGIVWSAGGFGEFTQNLLGAGLGPVATAGQLQMVSTGGLLGDSAEEASSFTLDPGSPVAGVLVRGDLQLAATGTVTDRFGDELLAFGHPFLGFGPVRLPMAASEVVTVISSTANSFKLANLGPVVGAFEEDRQAGVYGRIGGEAPVVPLKVHISGAGIPQDRTFEMELAHLKPMLPTLFAVTTIGTLESAGHGSGSQSLDLTARIRLKDYGDLNVEQSFDGEGAGTQSAIYLLSLAANALHTDMADVEVESVEVDLKRSEDLRTTRILGAYPDRAVVEPGETARIYLDLVHHGGATDRKTLEVEVPEDAPDGSFYLMIGDGVTADAARTTMQPAAPATYPQLLRHLRSLHSRRDLVVLGLVPDAGLAVDGEVLPRLPGSIRSLWSGAAPGSTQPLNLAVVTEKAERGDVPYSGLTRVDLEVRRR